MLVFSSIIKDCQAMVKRIPLAFSFCALFLSEKKKSQGFFLLTFSYERKSQLQKKMRRMAMIRIQMQLLSKRLQRQLLFIKISSLRQKLGDSCYEKFDMTKALCLALSVIIV